MKNEKRPMNYVSNDERTFFVGSNNAASATECTGLIPSPPESDAELLSYSDIYELPVDSKSTDDTKIYIPHYRKCSDDRRESLNFYE